MALNNRNNFVVAGIAILLAAVGAAAWIHESSSPPLAAPVVLTDAGAQVAPAAVTTGDGYYPITQPPAYIRPPQVAEAPASQPDDANDQDPEYRSYRERHHGRSKRHSVEIVAGTALAGAVIGGIAGGGPGAAIGAASGAGAGFAYDRLTHNH